MIQMKKIAAGVSMTLALGYGATAAAIPTPGAVADAYLILSNFTLLTGNNELGRGSSFLGNPNIAIQAVATNSDVSATIGATTNSESTSVGLGTSFSLQQTVGAGFVANTTLPSGTLNPTTYAGSATSSFGNALLDSVQPGSICGASNIGDCVPVHNQVNLTNAGATGSAQANQNLITEFQVTVGSDGHLFEMRFNAEGFLRAALGQDNLSANASFGWLATVRAVGSTSDILKWTPNGFIFDDSTASKNGLLATEGSCVMAGNCTEYADSFSMDNNVGLLSTGDVAISTGVGTFEVELFLNPGTYTFTISHNTNADAAIARVPEPGTMGLLGLGLLGLGLSLRRRAKL